MLLLTLAEQLRMRRLVGTGLLIGGLVFLYFQLDRFEAAVNGARQVDGQQLATVEPGAFVSYTPDPPAVETGILYGKKNNEGTHYLLLPIEEQFMLAAAGVKNTDGTLVGQVVELEGNHRRALTLLLKERPNLESRLIPRVLEAAGSFGGKAAMAFVFGLGAMLCGVGLIVLRHARPAPARVRSDVSRGS